MLKIGLTGGVACGKSYVSKQILASFPSGDASVFDCDEAVGELLSEPEIGRRIQEFPESPAGLTDGEGMLNRGILRELSFDNSHFRERLESLLHPLVLERALSYANRLSRDIGLLIWEVPLLYEVDFPIPRDIDLVVAASVPTQLERLATDRGIGKSLGRKIIDAQLPIEDKIARADVVIWNDGDLLSLNAQIEHLIERWRTPFS